MLAIRLATAPETPDTAPPVPSTTAPPTTAPTDTPPDGTVDTTAPPSDPDPAGDSSENIAGLFRDTRDVIGDVWQSLGTNGYQTSLALIAATVALIMMRTIKVKNYILFPVTAGAFWAGWLLFNTVMVTENRLFPGDTSPTKIWDFALTDQWSFFISVAAGCVAAVALWRNGQKAPTRAVLIVGTVFGASLVCAGVNEVLSR